MRINPNRLFCVNIVARYSEARRMVDMSGNINLVKIVVHGKGTGIRLNLVLMLSILIIDYQIICLYFYSTINI